MKSVHLSIGNAVNYNSARAREILSSGEISLKSFENFGKSDKVGSKIPLGFQPNPTNKDKK